MLATSKKTNFCLFWDEYKIVMKRFHVTLKHLFNSVTSKQKCIFRGRIRTPSFCYTAAQFASSSSKNLQSEVIRVTTMVNISMLPYFLNFLLSVLLLYWMKLSNFIVKGDQQKEDMPKKNLTWECRWRRKVQVVILD